MNALAVPIGLDTQTHDYPLPLQLAEEIPVGNNPLYAVLVSIESNSRPQMASCPTFITHITTPTSPLPS